MPPLGWAMILAAALAGPDVHSRRHPMHDFSIDAAQERIVDPRTRSYSKEFSSSYANENYRSAVVMLWSVVVCDLLFKMEFLSTTHGDKTAATILTEIEALRLKNLNSPEWERELVEKIR